jgi:hypothetical protein
MGGQKYVRCNHVQMFPDIILYDNFILYGYGKFIVQEFLFYPD